LSGERSCILERPNESKSGSLARATFVFGRAVAAGRLRGSFSRLCEAFDRVEVRVAIGVHAHT